MPGRWRPLLAGTAPRRGLGAPGSPEPGLRPARVRAIGCPASGPGWTRAASANPRRAATGGLPPWGAWLPGGPQAASGGDPGPRGEAAVRLGTCACVSFGRTNPSSVLLSSRPERGKAAGLQSSSGVAPPGDSRSGESVGAGGCGGWPLGSEAASTGTMSSEDSTLASPGVRGTRAKFVPVPWLIFECFENC